MYHPDFDDITPPSFKPALYVLTMVVGAFLVGAAWTLPTVNPPPRRTVSPLVEMPLTEAQTTATSGNNATPSAVEVSLLEMGGASDQGTAHDTKKSAALTSPAAPRGNDALLPDHLERRPASE